MGPLMGPLVCLLVGCTNYAARSTEHGKQLRSTTRDQSGTTHRHRHRHRHTHRHRHISLRMKHFEASGRDQGETRAGPDTGTGTDTRTDTASQTRKILQVGPPRAFQMPQRDARSNNNNNSPGQLVHTTGAHHWCTPLVHTTGAHHWGAPGSTLLLPSASLPQPSKHVKYDRSSLPQPPRHVKYYRWGLPEPSRCPSGMRETIIITGGHHWRSPLGLPELSRCPSWMREAIIIITGGRHWRSPLEVTTGGHHWASRSLPDAPAGCAKQ